MAKISSAVKIKRLAAVRASRQTEDLKLIYLLIYLFSRARQQLGKKLKLKNHPVLLCTFVSVAYELCDLILATRVEFPVCSSLARVLSIAQGNFLRIIMQATACVHCQNSCLQKSNMKEISLFRSVH